MASFYAELHLAGSSYRVVHCSYVCQQATDARGRAQAKVRHSPLELVLDVPDDDQLLDWAHAPHKPLAGAVVFYDVVAQVAHETIAFAAGECVQYAEQFASGAADDGAYVCQLTITAPSFELRAGGPVAAVVPTEQKVQVQNLITPTQQAPAIALEAVAQQIAPVAPAEYTPEEFKRSIWGADKVDAAIISTLYQHFNDAKASADPAPHWAAMEHIVRATTYLNAKGEAETLNGGWPPASGGFNKQLVQPAPPDKFDRYQKAVEADATGNPILGGTFTSPVPPGGPFDYASRALEGPEESYDLQYEIAILKPLPFSGEQATIIPWHGHEGNGTQTKMLFPPKDPATGLFPWDWKKLQREGYVRVTYKGSPSGKFAISSDGSTAKIIPA